MADQELPRLVPERMQGRVTREAGKAPIAEAAWYVAHEPMDRLCYSFPPGALAGARYLTADLLADGVDAIVFALELQEGEGGPRFHMPFFLINQCQARIRLPLEAVDQNRWQLGREGAWLKPMCGGDRVDLTKVDRMVLAVIRKSEEPARFCLTPFTATAEEPPRLTDPILPKGPLLDELGQSTLRSWPGKSRSAEEVVARLKDRLAAAPQQRRPEGWSRWGGSTAIRFPATGHFRTHHDGKRWWLVDPEGCAFWSTGLDCVSVDTALFYAGLEKALSWMPDREGPFGSVYSDRRGGSPHINYLQANLIRAFGPDDWYARWSEIALADLRQWGFNTVGNWSDWEVAKAAGVPYVRPLHFSSTKTPSVFRDFPDVFHPSFEEEAAAYAEQLRDSAGDPAMIGYFLMNEPTWGFASQTPAAGMLLNTPSCATRARLAEFLRQKYGSDAGLASAWGTEVGLGEVAEGAWTKPLAEAAQADLRAFSTIMVERLFAVLSEACRAVAPDHLNLGARYYTVPPDWALEGMGCFDVFSVNCYHEKVNPQLGELSARVGRPVMVGEWHFGALDVGLPASGIGRVRDQEARGRAFRVYLEDAAAQPWCVGAHYFILYDQSALGRFDGECYNIGFLDVTNRPYEPLCRAARAAHERLYDVATGAAKPYDDAPQYLMKLFA
jgi:hypothetical protein